MGFEGSLGKEVMLEAQNGYKLQFGDTIAGFVELKVEYKIDNELNL